MPDSSAHQSTSATRFVLRLLGSALRRHRRRTLVALGLVLLAKGAMVTVPLALKGIVDRLGGDLPASMVVPVMLVVAYASLRFLGTFFGEIRDVVFSRVTQVTVADFLLQVFGHLHRLSVGFHARRRTGGLTRDVERGTAGIGFLLGVGLFTIVPTLVEISAVVAITSLAYSLWFTAIIVATFIGYASFTFLFTERRAVFQRAMNKLDSSANGRLVDSLLNHETVKYYTNEPYESQRFRSILGEWVEVGVGNQKALSMLHVGQSLIIALGVSGVMLMATWHVFHGAMSVGDLILVNAYVIQICMPLNSLGFVFRQARDAVVNAENMLRLLDQKPEVDDVPGAIDLPAPRGEIRFEHVEFGYDPSRQILWDVSFTIPPGRKLAVVGGSGSGKSTLARLLFRFYDVGAGRITIDDVDIRAVSQRSLRQAIGIVPQDTILFNDTIRYNIAYGRIDVDDDEIVAAAKAAHIHDFIASLPQGYDTQVGERGVMISGGEKQRIAIARALLKNPPVMVFDEATSALDTRSERSIQDELDRLARDRTTLVIAHRLSTIVDADEIIVLDRGRVVQRGVHRDLVEAEGLYAQLWNLQRQEREVERAGEVTSRQRVNMVSVLGGVVDGLRDEIEASGVGFYSTIATDRVQVSGDPGWLQHLVWSLVSGAIGQSPRGGRVDLRLEGEGDDLCLRILHAGSTDPAMAPLDAALEQARLRGIAESNRGRLDFLPAGDGIAESRLVLPVRIDAPVARAPDDTAGSPARVEATSAPGVGSISGACVLVIDDDQAARDFLEQALHAHGALSRTSATGREALDWLFATPRTEWPDVVICDVSLGDEDGYEVIQLLRRFESERGFGVGDRLPAIALSHYDRNVHRMRSLLAGFQAHLAKPVEPAHLAAVVAVAIGHRGVATLAPPVGEASGSEF